MLYADGPAARSRDGECQIAKLTGNQNRILLKERGDLARTSSTP